MNFQNVSNHSRPKTEDIAIQTLSPKEGNGSSQINTIAASSIQSLNTQSHLSNNNAIKFEVEALHSKIRAQENMIEELQRKIQILSNPLTIDRMENEEGKDKNNTLVRLSNSFCILCNSENLSKWEYFKGLFDMKSEANTLQYIDDERIIQYVENKQIHFDSVIDLRDILLSNNAETTGAEKMYRQVFKILYGRKFADFLRYDSDYLMGILSILSYFQCPKIFLKECFDLVVQKQDCNALTFLKEFENQESEIFDFLCQHVSKSYGKIQDDKSFKELRVLTQKQIEIFYMQSLKDKVANPSKDVHLLNVNEIDVQKTDQKWVWIIDKAAIIKGNKFSFGGTDGSFFEASISYNSFVRDYDMEFKWKTGIYLFDYKVFDENNTKLEQPYRVSHYTDNTAKILLTSVYALEKLKKAKLELTIKKKI